jgi:hypothetical protein
MSDAEPNQAPGRTANEWFVRQARRVLHERAAAGKLADKAATHAGARQLLAAATDAPASWRAVWALHATGGIDGGLLEGLLRDPDAYGRGWAIRLEVEDRELSAEMLEAFTRLAREDASPVVRLHLASALQRLPAEARWPVATALAARAEDAKDPNLPLMIWYGVEPLVPEDVGRSIELVRRAKIPLLREHIARRLATGTQQAARTGE